MKYQKRKVKGIPDNELRAMLHFEGEEELIQKIYEETGLKIETVLLLKSKGGSKDKWRGTGKLGNKQRVHGRKNLQAVKRRSKVARIGRSRINKK